MDPELPVTPVEPAVKDWKDIVEHYFESQKNLVLVLENLLARINKLESV